MRQPRIKIHNDGYNEIIFKPSTNKVVIGMNISSYMQSKYASFKANSTEEALKIGTDYINKKSKVKI